MPSEAVLYRKEDDVGLITFNRPERLNAINRDLLDGLIRCLLLVKDDDFTTCAVLTGNGRAFCAGEDLKESAAGKSFDDWVREVDALQEVQRVILGLGKPLIAAVGGYAVGGGLEFALSCDLRIAAADAMFGFPETSVGLTVTTAGTKLISQIVGLGKAKEMILTGEFVDAQTALGMGLVNQVVEREHLMNAALAMCAKIKTRSPLALKLSRTAVDQGLHASFEQTLEMEAAHLLTCIGARDLQGRIQQKLKTLKKP